MKLVSVCFSLMGNKGVCVSVGGGWRLPLGFLNITPALTPAVNVQVLNPEASNVSE